jgi:RNA polymerase sigma factor (sigma-70 family)
MMSDAQLLREYAEHGSEAAFGELVQRHINLVYSAAFRRLRNRQAAEEVAQTVFSLLATKARRLGPETALVSWLYKAASFTALKYWRKETRQRERELEASRMTMIDSENEDAVWQQLAPYLDDAINALNDADRVAILRRFFERQPLRDIGEALGIGEDAARMRVNRALEKLRLFLVRKGAVCSLALLGTLLAARAVEPAPTDAAQSVQKAALAAKLSGAASVSSILFALLKKIKGKTALSAALGVATALSIGLWLQKSGKQPVHANTPNVVNSLPGPQTPMMPIREPLGPSALFTMYAAPGALAIQPDGKILAGSVLAGFFVDEQSGTLGHYSRGVMRFHPDGSLDRTFYSDVGRPDSTSAAASQVALMPDGRIFISGTFDVADGKPRLGHSLLFPDGRLDESFNPWAAATNVTPRLFSPRLSYSSAMLGDGSIVVMSRPVEPWDGRPGYQPQYLWSAYRLDSSGRIASSAVTYNSLDLGRPKKLILTYSDVPHGPFPEVPLELVRYAVRLHDGGAVLAVRKPPFGGGQASLRRYDKNWRLDTSFTNEFEADRQLSELSLHLQPDGKILVAGLVGTMNGRQCSGLMRLEATGATDESFHCETATDASGRVMDVAIQPDGRIVICGFFSEVNGVPAEHIARLNSDGSLDSSFRPPFLSSKEFDRRRFARVARLTSTATRPARTRQSSSTASTNTAAEASETGEPEMIQIRGIALEGGMSVVRFVGRPHQVYILQARETINASGWTSIATNRANGGGTGILRDAASNEHPMRFYRIASP